ncbi:unnamed protein product [Macrosiphum euphorbiae]|uniref:Transposable element P transposase n=1 Tax=Macrosiphum euphorbiae TaxID=13131 RepID=A0AAV0VVS9_9HEMI|nr:unnamed protein product [Macrosiphum euphorbiae]
MEEQLFNIKFQQKLSGIFTSTQINLILNKKKAYKWSDEDLSSAISLRSISPKGYRYLREKKKYPLPALSTLRSWACKFSVDQGILHQVLSLLKAKRESMSRNDKITVISFDETYISRKICYDKGKDQIIGPYKCVQVVMARGLLSNWKQPLFYDFDTPMTTEILFKIIACIHEVGFEVVALVSDMGPTNIGLWKSLNITPSSPSFINPVTLKNIHVFADVPHLLKLIRNHFIDRGFIFSNNTYYIGRQIIEEYLDMTNEEIVNGANQWNAFNVEALNKNSHSVNIKSRMNALNNLKLHNISTNHSSQPSNVNYQITNNIPGQSSPVKSFFKPKTPIAHKLFKSVPTVSSSFPEEPPTKRTRNEFKPEDQYSNNEISIIQNIFEGIDEDEMFNDFCC